MLDTAELHDLEQMRANLMCLHGQNAFAGADDLSAQVIDMEVIIAPLDTVIAWARLNWKYAMSLAEARIIMRRWQLADEIAGIQNLQELDEVVRIARAIKRAFPARDVNQCAARASYIGSISKLREAQDDETYGDDLREQFKAILTALDSP
jgi:hypothetical protein